LKKEKIFHYLWCAEKPRKLQSITIQKPSGWNVAGKGIGGFQVFNQLAKAFCKTALSNAKYVTVTRAEWNLSPFLEGIPSGLVPPAGFSAFRVTEIATTSIGRTGSELVLRAEKGRNIHQHAYELGIRLSELPPQYVRSIAIALTALSTPEDIGPREVQVYLTWPNGRSFDGVTLSDQTIIEPWLESPQFHLTH
jgi:hypothetical protein